MSRRRKRGPNLILPILLIIAVIVGIYWYQNREEAEEEEETTTESEVIVTDIYSTISSSSYVSTALEEKKELHATYYFSEMYYDKNQIIRAGENIIKYTNGTYFTAPYDCIITAYSLPDSGEMCTNSHYITLQSIDTLQMSLTVEEDKLDTVYLGQEAKINIDTIEDKTYTGYVTAISNTATYSSSGSTFAVTVEFQNDGDIMLGMSATCEVVLEKAENVIAVATDAVTKSRGQASTVQVKKENGDTETVEIETGISNDAYIEVKSGLEEGDIVLIEKTTTSTGFGGFGGGGQMQDAGGDMPTDMGGGMQGGGDMPSMGKPDGGDFQMK